MSRRGLSLPGRIALHTVLIVVGFFMLAPLLWMLSTSLKEPGDIFIYPPQWIPDPVVWQNYVETVTVMPFGRFYFNSTFQAAAVTVLQLLTSSLAAFAFARLRFRGRDLLFLLYLGTMMIPFPVTMIPNFIIVRLLGWIDTFKALILPPAFSAFSTFLLRQYFLSLPIELDDAARVDGASSFRIWWQVLLPLTGPAHGARHLYVSRPVEQLSCGADRHQHRAHARTTVGNATKAIYVGAGWSPLGIVARRHLDISSLNKAGSSRPSRSAAWVAGENRTDDVPIFDWP